ncbi:hypothetical protein B9G54_03435 [Alloscardovia macacae]|uniref:Peptidase S54 rhomboid domain-containing protein n=1 Tax=Alloscardovia macacae TaxID=1160091 RepID=A0A1Y2SXB9_9BIFI|nr:rhomboid family intramembrane serine protease [Alloscardovia macacae]OTA26846.1 hypothetical protein B9G54_03435 [Alloscardovia macacae]OTA29129.1 hypothetical protein B9T39_04410 [Alloscardovia macacae]
MANPFTRGTSGPAGPWDPRNPNRNTASAGERWQRFTRRWSNTWRMNGPNMTQVLVALNVLIFLVDSLLRFFPRLSNIFLSYTVLVPNFAYMRPWTLLTTAFLHGGILHILMNMLSLYFVGKELEKMLGHWAFLSMYLVSAIGANVVYALWPGMGMVPAVGASGAIYGLFAAMMTVYNRIGARSQSTLVLLFFLLVVPIFFGNVAWQAHLGGFVTGGALSLLMMHGLPALRTASIHKRMSIYGSALTVLLLGVWVAAAFI